MYHSTLLCTITSLLQSKVYICGRALGYVAVISLQQPIKLTELYRRKNKKLHLKIEPSSNVRSNVHIICWLTLINCGWEWNHWNTCITQISLIYFAFWSIFRALQLRVWYIYTNIKSTWLDFHPRMTQQWIGLLYKSTVSIVVCQKVPVQLKWCVILYNSALLSYSARCYNVICDCACKNRACGHIKLKLSWLVTFCANLLYVLPF